MMQLPLRILPGWGEDMPHAPGSVVPSEVGVSLGVFICHSDSVFSVGVHLYFPIMLGSHWDQIAKHCHTSEQIMTMRHSTDYCTSATVNCSQLA